MEIDTIEQAKMLADRGGQFRRQSDGNWQCLYVDAAPQQELVPAWMVIELIRHGELFEFTTGIWIKHGQKISEE